MYEIIPKSSLRCSCRCHE